MYSCFVFSSLNIAFKKKVKLYTLSLKKKSLDFMHLLAPTPLSAPTHILSTFRSPSASTWTYTVLENLGLLEKMILGNKVSGPIRGFEIMRSTNQPCAASSPS